MIILEDKKDWLHHEVITETGVFLGYVRRVCLNEEDVPTSLVIVRSRIRWLPAGLLGIYTLNVPHIVCISPRRLTVVEGSEQQLGYCAIGIKICGIDIGIPLRIRICPPWTQEEADTDDATPVGQLLDFWYGDNEDTGLQPAIKPRKPSPKPTEDAAEIPTDYFSDIP